MVKMKKYFFNNNVPLSLENSQNSQTKEKNELLLAPLAHPP